jgi:hypothetical protein
MNALFASLLLLGAPAHASWQQSFRNAIQKTEAMVWDTSVDQIVRRHGLRALNVTWEDTGRSKGSVWGPNISDMTIGVRDPSGALHPMPVIRFENFSDKTADLHANSFFVRVGNERGGPSRNISVAELLRHPRRYMHAPSSWAGSLQSLWASRDEHLLVSAQACFLPIPQYGEATFTPVLYNYQSSPGNPAVLAIVATREGTSMQVVENEGGYLSEVLYFNENGERAPFTAERATDALGLDSDDRALASRMAEEAGMNVVLLIQVPLKQRPVARYSSYGDGYGSGSGVMADFAAPPCAKSAAMGRSDTEAAVVGHGTVEGPFKEFNDLAIERDPRYPVRVTVQFYKATSTGVISNADVAAIRKQIDRVYAQGDYVGSLVTGGYTARPTEWNPQPYPTKPTYTRETDPWADGSWTWLKSQ